MARQAVLIEYGFVLKGKPLRKRGVQFRFTKQLKSKSTSEYREKLEKKFLMALTSWGQGVEKSPSERWGNRTPYNNTFTPLCQR